MRINGLLIVLNVKLEIGLRMFAYGTNLWRGPAGMEMPAIVANPNSLFVFPFKNLIVLNVCQQDAITFLVSFFNFRNAFE